MPRLSSLCLLLAACGAEPPAPAPAPAPPPAPGADVPEERVLSEAEYALLRDDLEDLRAGLRPFDAESLGVCAWDGSACTAFLGRDAGELPPGSYQLWAELRAPRLGGPDGWPVTLRTTCTTQGAQGSSERSNEREYTVRYAGEERGYRLRLRSIESPSPGRPVSCTWTLSAETAPGAPSWSGSFSVPGEAAP